MAVLEVQGRRTILGRMRQFDWGQLIDCQFVILQQMCEHSRKAKIFCINQECSHNLWYGCVQCMKKCHKGGKEQLLQQEELLQMMKVYQVPNHIKQQRKDTIYKVYNALNNIKNQIYDHIDTYFNSILSKIKYPFLYHQNILQAYRFVRDKNYHKMGQSKLTTFCKTSKATNNQDFISKEIKYYQQYLQQTHHSLQILTQQISTIENIFNFGITKESHLLHKELLKELSSFGEKRSTLDIKQLNLGKEVVKSWTSLKGTEHLQNNSAAQNDLSINLNNSLRLELPKEKTQSFLTPRKQERDLDLSFEKTASILPNEESEAKAIHLSQTQNMILPEESIVSKGMKNKSAVQQRSKDDKKDKQKIKEDKQKIEGQLREYSNNQSNTNSIFIKISEVVNIEKRGEKSDSKLTKSTINQDKSSVNENQSKSTIRDDKQKKEILVKQKQENVKKRLTELIKSKDQEKKPELPSINNKSTSQLNQTVALKTKLEVKPSYFLNVTSKRKGSRHQSQFNDSLGKDVFEFAREQKPKIISRSIKKEIPYIDLTNSVKTEPVPKNNSFLIEGQQNSKDKELQIAAIFMSGINQPLSQNKICFLQKYLEKYENNLTAVEFLTYLYLEKGKFKQCLNLCSRYLDKLKECLANNQCKMTLVINKSGALNNLGRYSQAIKLLQEYLKTGQNDKIHKNIADAYYNINVLDKAIYHYQKAIKYNSQFDEAYFNVAVILYRQQSFFNAKMNIEKALRINKTQENYLQLHSHIQERISMNDNRV